MDLPIVMELIDNELSEPYSIFTYRYFLHHWPHLCFIAKQHGKPIGTVVSKVEVHRGQLLRGYIAMLTVVKDCRSLGIGSMLVRMTIEGMIAVCTEEVALEAEVTNDGAIKLYEKLGFIRAKRLRRYYLNGNDAYRLKLLLPGGEERREDREAAHELQHMSLVVT
jgi:N-alpha-acetyltransferase 30